MKITSQELAVINVSISVDAEGRPKQFPMNELNLALKISEKIQKFLGKEQEEDGMKFRPFKDGQIELSTEEKSFLLTHIERSWSLQQAQAVIKLKEKLQ